jgi:hypothetical protein
MRWRSASATASSLATALVLAGCGGGGERPPVSTSLRLARLADRVATGKDCGRPLVEAMVAAVDRGEIPPGEQERLLSDANKIAATCSRAAARALADRLAP